MSKVPIILSIEAVTTLFNKVIQKHIFPCSEKEKEIEKEEKDEQIYLPLFFAIFFFLRNLTI